MKLEKIIQIIAMILNNWKGIAEIEIEWKNPSDKDRIIGKGLPDPFIEPGNIPFQEDPDPDPYVYGKKNIMKPSREEKEAMKVPDLDHIAKGIGAEFKLMPIPEQEALKDLYRFKWATEAQLEKIQETTASLSSWLDKLQGADAGKDVSINQIQDQLLKVTDLIDAVNTEARYIIAGLERHEEKLLKLEGRIQDLEKKIPDPEGEQW